VNVKRLEFSAPRPSIPAALAVVLVGAASCYSPSISNGGVACNKEYQTDFECPSGYACRVDHRCWLKGTGPTGPDGSVDQAMDMKEAGPVEVRPDGTVEAPPDLGPMCIVAPMGCTPLAGATTCDLLCQTGCPKCDQKCSVNTTTGAPTCNAPMPGLARNMGESCTPVSQGTASQTDNCKPGLVCFPSVQCGSSCVKFCRVDADCPGSGCSRMFPNGTKYCDVPVVTCNPVTIAGPTGCMGNAQGCYLSTTVADETRCDCPGAALEGADCTFSRDCFPGLVCADPTGQSHFTCQRACKLTGTPNGCANNVTCNPIKGSKTFGFCSI
jgi:hypothetical protein